MIQSPPTIHSNIATALGIHATVPNALDSRSSAATSVSYSYEAGNMQSAASSISSIRTAVDLLLQKGGSMITIHPWTYGIAETGQGKYSEQLRGFLSIENALGHLDHKLADIEDAATSSANEMIVISMSATTPENFLTSIKSINQVFPIGDLLLCQKRIEQILIDKTEKMNRKQPAHNPYWQDFETVSIEVCGSLIELSEEIMSSLEALADDGNPITELQNFINEKKEEMTTIESSWSNLMAGLASDSINVSFSTLSQPYNVADLNNIQNNNSNSFAAVVALVGKDGDLNIFREIFNV